MRETLYLAYTDLIRSVKNDRYKLIEYTGNVRKTQLFDLANDLLEVNNLYGQKEFDSVVHQLRNELIKHSDEWDDQLHPLGKAFWERLLRFT